MQTSTALQAYSLCTLSPYISSFILGVEVPVPLILPAQHNQWEEWEQQQIGKTGRSSYLLGSQWTMRRLGSVSRRTYQFLPNSPSLPPLSISKAWTTSEAKLLCESINIIKIPVLFSFVYLATRGVVKSIMSSLILNMLWCPKMDRSRFGQYCDPLALLRVLFLG